MAEVGYSDLTVSGQPERKPTSRLSRLLALPAFQAWVANTPVLWRFARYEGVAMFDLVAGFCHSQVLQAIVRLRIPPLLLTEQMTADALARAVQMPTDRMQILLDAGVAIRLLKCRRGYYRLTLRGTALAGVPGLQGMIDHHDVMYRDLTDPVAFFRGEVETELAAFWPYVFGAGGASDPAVVARYSALMADSQTLVAADTLAAVNWRGLSHVLDVGGGTGAFLCALGAALPQPRLTLFDLPAVVPAAQQRFAAAGLEARAQAVAGSFRDDPLPTGADMITLVRVLYDHDDDTVARILRAAKAALPVGGRLVVSEPMRGGARPHRAGDAYFALYCMAMRTGRARSAAQIAALMQDAGFSQIKTPRPRRAFITSVVEGVNPD